MNLSTFDAIPFDDQLHLLREQGTYLMTRKGRKCRIGLYQLGLIYVEVWYDAEDTCVKMVRGFACSTFLEPYLGEIQVVNLHAQSW